MVNIHFGNPKERPIYGPDLVKKLEKKKKDKYAFKNYKPNKNCVPVTYNGKEYKSKAQCIALEGITRKELNDYLASLED